MCLRSDPPDELTEAVLTASRALVGVAARSLAAAADDVTLPQYRALVVLAARGPQRVGDLAESLGVHPSTATRLCDRLVDRRLVRRAIDRTNRRETTIALSRQGPHAGRRRHRRSSRRDPRDRRAHPAALASCRRRRAARLRRCGRRATCRGVDARVDVKIRERLLSAAHRDELRTLRSRSHQVLLLAAITGGDHRAGRRRVRAPRRRGDVRERARPAAVADRRDARHRPARRARGAPLHRRRRLPVHGRRVPPRVPRLGPPPRLAGVRRADRGRRRDARLRRTDGSRRPVAVHRGRRSAGTCSALGASRCAARTTASCSSPARRPASPRSSRPRPPARCSPSRSRTAATSPDGCSCRH